MIAFAKPDTLLQKRRPRMIIADSNEWYTPAIYVGAARTLMEGIDLDPASNEVANQVVRAKLYYDIYTNGLDKPWRGRVWLNPPYGLKTTQAANAGTWVNRLIDQYEQGVTTEAVLLVNVGTDRRWFDPLWQYPICFVSKRIAFYNIRGVLCRPMFANSLVYFGKNERRFAEIFSRFGPVTKRISPPKILPINPSLWEVSK